MYIKYKFSNPWYSHYKSVEKAFTLSFIIQNNQAELYLYFSVSEMKKLALA